MAPSRSGRRRQPLRQAFGPLPGLPAYGEVKGSSVDQRADENGATRERVADLHRGIDLFQSGDESIIDITMHEQPTQRRAALACSANRSEGNRAKREVEIGRQIGRASCRERGEVWVVGYEIE